MSDEPIDLHEVARAIEEMFAPSAEMGEAEPNLDLIADILKEKFPGITMAQLDEAGAIFRKGLPANDR